MKILAFANSHSVAHVTRVLEVFKVFRQHGHECIFAGDSNYTGIMKEAGFEVRFSPFVSIEKIERAVRESEVRDLYPEDEVREHIQHQRGLIAELKPDSVLVDNVVSAILSAQIEKVPCVSLVNLHFTNYRKYPFIKLARQTPARVKRFVSIFDGPLKLIENRFMEHLVYSSLSKLRKEFKLSRRFGYSHEAADLVLIPDHPQINIPGKPIPSNYHFVGPLTWHAPFPLPADFNPPKDKKLIYYSIGSGGVVGELRELAQSLAGKCHFVVTLGNSPVSDEWPENVTILNYVDADQLLQFCDLIVCHGGNGTLYQALRHGVPTLVVANSIEQFYGGDLFERLGLGRALLRGDIEARGSEFIASEICTILDNPKYLLEAKAKAKLADDSESAKLAYSLIVDFVNQRN